jgi:hypothetical protein
MHSEHQRCAVRWPGVVGAATVHRGDGEAGRRAARPLFQCGKGFRSGWRP